MRFLICTDVAARGIDIRELPYVINMTLPDKSEDYIHRVGQHAAGLGGNHRAAKEQGGGRGRRRTLQRWGRVGIGCRGGLRLLHGRGQMCRRATGA